MADRESGQGKDKRQRDERKDGGRDKGRNNNGDNNYLSPDRGCLENSPSLQRIHQQSSTETSGLGETITSGFSSQESIRSVQSGIHETGGKVLCNHEGLRNQLRTGRDPCEEVNATNRQMLPETDTRPLINNNAYEKRRITRPEQERTPTYKAHHAPERARKSSRTMQQPPNTEGPNFDALFTESEARQTQQCNYPGLNVNDVDTNWSRRGSTKSNISVSSKGSNKFLGKNFESAWTKWSKERRASYQRKLQPPEDDEPVQRASTPVKKARQECLQFLHPDLEKYYLSEEDKHYIRQHRQQRNQIHNVIEKPKKGRRTVPCHTEVMLTEQQWHILQDFWNHSVFCKTRYAALFFGFVTTVLMIVSITSNYWSSYIMTNALGDNVSAHEGLFKNCSTVISPDHDEIDTCDVLVRGTFKAGMWDNCFHPKNLSEKYCTQTLQHWQNAVIGLMIFSASFGFLAAVLAVCGVCTSPLPKKIYYFHSAGEIFLVCALSTGIALIIYPIAIEVSTDIDSHQYGHGYGFGWGSAFFFLVSAFCMSLDELVRESSRAKCCRLCWRSRNSERAELQSV